MAGAACRACGTFNDMFNTINKGEKKVALPMKKDEPKTDAPKQESKVENKKESPAALPVAAKSTEPESRKGCPEDKDTLGRATWSFLHTMAAYYPPAPPAETQRDMEHMVTLLGKFYPCSHCAEHLREYVQRQPPTTASRADLMRWFCDYHNDVNRLQGKPLFNCADVEARWFTGWPDGSCDWPEP